jgi:hypothetical protein
MHLCCNHFLLAALQLQIHGLERDVNNLAVKDISNVFDGAPFCGFALHLQESVLETSRALFHIVAA